MQLQNNNVLKNVQKKIIAKQKIVQFVQKKQLKRYPYKRYIRNIPMNNSYHT